MISILEAIVEILPNLIFYFSDLAGLFLANLKKKKKKKN